MTPDQPFQPDPSSPVAEQLQRGFPWLRFERSLEFAYQREQHESGLVQLRLNIALALGLVLAFTAMNRMVLETPGGLVAWLRYAAVLPSLLLCLVVTFVPHGARLYRGVIAVLAPVILIAVTAYKSRRADPDAWIIGGYATKEVIDRAKFQPQLVGPDLKKEDIAFLGTDPGDDVTEGWWDEMLVQWFDVPEEEKPAEGEEEGKNDETESAATEEGQSSKT